MFCKVEDGTNVIEYGHDFLARIHKSALFGSFVGTGQAWYGQWAMGDGYGLVAMLVAMLLAMFLMMVGLGEQRVAS
jgi:hypothetical protein